MREGTKKTVCTNFMQLCKDINRQPEHVQQFLLAELGTSGSLDGQSRLTVKGRFQPKNFEGVLRRYVNEWAPITSPWSKLSIRESIKMKRKHIWLFSNLVPLTHFQYQYYQKSSVDHMAQSRQHMCKSCEYKLHVSGCFHHLWLVGFLTSLHMWLATQLWGVCWCKRIFSVKNLTGIMFSFGLHYMWKGRLQVQHQYTLR